MYRQTRWEDRVTEYEDRYKETQNPDGTFTHTVKPGWGIAARLLADAGLDVMDEDHLQA